ncbi:hypothetical protein [Arcobacter sp. YIC-310]|uniref:hypothetical protein n=1 Tax=Arcobacter sp. YIC-310 TaxID=3376632 RepID=UPI003C22BE19
MDTIKTIEKINGINISNKFKLIEQNDNYVLYLENELIGREYYKRTNSNTDADDESILTYCGFSEINHLFFTDLINGIKFNFAEIHYYDNNDASYINENLYLASVNKKNNKVFFEFWFKINLFDYKGKDNPILKSEEFEKLLKSEENINIYSKHSDGETGYLEFYYEFENGALNEVFESAKNLILNLYSNSFNTKENSLEAIFELPEEYQSILKPYLLYFEEFLNDLCIESNVNIQKVDKETILSVEPKNRDEALEKISEALKAYLCAPVISNELLYKETMGLQTSLMKLSGQCKHLESQLMLKDVSLQEQTNKLILKDNIINESKRILVESGVDSKIITQDNTILLESLKSINFDKKEIDKKTFLKSFKFNMSIPLFKGAIEIKKDKFK